MQMHKFHLAMRIGLLENLLKVAAYRVVGDVQETRGAGEAMPRE